MISSLLPELDGLLRGEWAVSNSGWRRDGGRWEGKNRGGNGAVSLNIRVFSSPR